MSQTSRDEKKIRKLSMGEGSAPSTLSDHLLTEQEKGEAAVVDPNRKDIHEVGLGAGGLRAYYDVEAVTHGDDLVALEDFEDGESPTNNTNQLVVLANARGSLNSADEDSGGKREEIYHIKDGADNRRCFDCFTYIQLSKLITGKDAKTIRPRTFAIYCFAAVGAVGAAPLSYQAGTTIAGENFYGATLGFIFAAFSYPAFIVLVSAVFKMMYQKYSIAKASKVQLAELQDSSGATKRNTNSTFVEKLPARIETLVVVLLSLSAAVQFASATEAALSGKQESFVRSHDLESLPAFLVSLLFAYVAMAVVNFAGNAKTKMRLDKYWLDYRHPETAALRKQIKQYLRKLKLEALSASEGDIDAWTRQCFGLPASKEAANEEGMASADKGSKEFIAANVIECAVDQFDVTRLEQTSKNSCKRIVGFTGALVGAAAGYAYYAMSYQAIERYFGEEATESDATFAFALFACAGHAMITAIPLEMWAIEAYHRCTDSGYRSSYSSTQVVLRGRAAWASAFFGASATIPILYLTYKFIEQSGINRWFNLFLLPIFLGPWALRTETLKQEANSYISFRDKDSTPLELQTDRLQAVINGAIDLVERAEVKDITLFSKPLRKLTEQLVQREEEVYTPGSTGSTNSQTPLTFRK
jgi:hypothetical protein